MGEIEKLGSSSSPSSSTAIKSSNIGFQLLKKCGWKEGTGLGVAEQGRLEPLQAHVKNNKSGLGAEKVRGPGAEKVRKKVPQHPKDDAARENNDDETLQQRKKAKRSSKRLKKMLDEEKRVQEKEFEMAFFREFWPDNV